MKSALFLVLVMFFFPLQTTAQAAPPPWTLNWDEGSSECAKSSYAPLQVRAYDAQTFVLRESLCATFEAPFMYLLVGSSKALLIDTGDVADAEKMPLARTVLDLLPGSAGARLPLLVAHTHRHLDHRSGDRQFAGLPKVRVVGYDLDSVKQFFGLKDWPNGTAQVELGNRIVDVIPTPGHNETEVSFYDRNTELFFSGDFLMPGRLLIDDAQADLSSALRAARFANYHPISYILGGHIEENDRRQMYAWESTYHPAEHPLPLSQSDLQELPSALRNFNGFHTATGNFVLMNSVHILIAVGCGLAILLVMLFLFVFRCVKRRRVSKTPAPAVP